MAGFYAAASACVLVGMFAYAGGNTNGYHDGFKELCTTNHGVVIQSNGKLLCVDPKVIEVTK